MPYCVWCVGCERVPCLERERVPRREWEWRGAVGSSLSGASSRGGRTYVRACAEDRNPGGGAGQGKGGCDGVGCAWHARLGGLAGELRGVVVEAAV